MTSAIEAKFPPDAFRAAERAVGQLLGARTWLLPPEILASSDRSMVARCGVDSEARTAPATVVVKVARSAGGPYKPWRQESRRRLQSDWAGPLFLSSLRGPSPLAPRLLTGVASRGLLILEDAGNGESLATLLQGEDPAKAEQGLIAYLRLLGRMGAASAGRLEEYESLLGQLGARWPEFAGWRDETQQTLARASEILAPGGVDWSDAVAADVEKVSATVLDPGPWLVYSHGDPCPDNNRIILDDKGGAQALLFDFERAGFRHALLDGAYARFPFPTCWCVNAMPPGLERRLEQAYRVELAARVPDAADHTAFERAMVECCAYWLIETSRWHLAQSLETDAAWGLSTIRQRFLHRFEAFGEQCATAGHLEALGDFMATCARKLKERWPEVEEMPVYPAFRD